MKNMRMLLLMTALMGFLPFVCHAQNDAQKPVFVPEEGIEGKDVIWWPTHNALVKAMLDKANVGPDDFVVDLGSGDGRIVLEAARRGAHATGIEFNPDLVRLSEYRAQQEGLSDKAKFLNMDLFEYDLSKATVITMYLLSELNLRLRPTLLELKPGTRIVSNSFDLGDWEADEEIFIDRSRSEPGDGERYYSTSSLGYFWIVPAKVEGTWKLADGTLQLSQKYQKISGQYKAGRKSVEIEGASLRGDEITFRIDQVVYKGKVEGNRIKGVSQNGTNSSPFTATRN